MGHRLEGRCRHMVAKPHPLEKSARAIEAALRGFTHFRGSDGLLIRENEWGHLEVVLGCHAFKDMTDVERQDAVWGFLRATVDPDDLAQLSRVHAVDREEYDATVRGL